MDAILLRAETTESAQENFLCRMQRDLCNGNIAHCPLYWEI